MKTPTTTRAGARAGWGALLLLGTLAGSGRPAAAQGAACPECTQEAHRATDQELREARAQLRVVRRELAALQRAERDDDLRRTLRDAEAALSKLDPADRGARTALSRALARVTVQGTKLLSRGELRDPDRYARVVQTLAELQGRLASAQAVRLLEQVERQRLQHDVRERVLVEQVDSDSRTGWLGVTYSGDAPRSEPGRGRYFLYRSYPVIASVDPGSPAESAGIVAGDTILAFNGEDVRNRRIYLDDVLRPGSKLRVRVRRGGAVRETRVSVKAKPRTLTAVDASPLVEPRVRVLGREAFAPRPPRAAAAPRPPGVPPAPPAPPVPPAGGPGYFIWNGPSAVAGAELARMNGDLRDVLGVASGVLVISVGSGSPAANAGLRAGDVIVRAAGREVTSPGGVQRVVEHATDRRVELQVVRKQERRTVTLRW